MAYLKLYRGHRSGVTVSLLRVVEHFDVIEYNGPRLLSGGTDATPDSLSFEQLEETIDDGDAVAIATSSHAGPGLIDDHEITPVMATELAVLIVYILPAPLV